MIKENHTHTLPNTNLDIPIFTKLYAFYKDFHTQLRLFPKTERFTLGQKIDNTSLEIFGLISQVPLYSKDQKIEILIRMSSKIDILKILLRMSNDNRALGSKAYLLLQEKLQEIGKMAGGWLRYFKNS